MTPETRKEGMDVLNMPRVLEAFGYRKWDLLLPDLLDAKLVPYLLDKFLVKCIKQRGMPQDVADTIWNLRGDAPENRRSYAEQEGEGI